MRKGYYCPNCYNKWKTEEEKAFCCPICGEKAICSMERVSVEL